MTTKKFWTRVVVIFIIAILLTICANTFYNYVDVVVSNFLSVGQLENDDFAFAQMTLYTNTIRPIITVIYSAGILSLCAMAGLTAHKYIKTKEKEYNNEEID